MSAPRVPARLGVDLGRISIHPPSLGSGERLDAETAARMGRAFGEDFADVRFHTGAAAFQATQGLGTRAFTMGHHVAFAPGEYRPGTSRGDALLAHELAHVVQQRGGSAGARAGPAAGRHEEDAERGASAALSHLNGGPAPHLRSSPVGVALAPPVALAPHEEALSGTRTWTQALAEQAMSAYAALGAAAREAWVARWMPGGQLIVMLDHLARADVTVGGKFLSPLQDLLQRVQRAGALERAKAEGLADENAMAQTQATMMHARNVAAAKAAQPKGAPPPTTAQVAAQQKTQVSSTSIGTQTGALTPIRESQLTTQANAAVTTFVAWCTANHPDLKIKATHFRVAVREVFDRGEGVIAFADQVGGPRCVVGEEFIKAVTANPAYALPTVVHELWGHNEYGPYGQPRTEYGLELYDKAAKKMPGYVQPVDTAVAKPRTKEIDAYAYQETEMYSLMKEVDYYTPNAPAHKAALDSINYDPAGAIASRIGLIKSQWEPKVARSLLRGLCLRYRLDPRISPKAFGAFKKGVQKHFPAEAADILK